MAGKEIVYGLTFNNSPTTQDVWNTLPAWGYPYTSSGLAPKPSTAPLIAGALAQNVVGLSGYVWIDSKLYIEAGGYSSPARGTLRWLGADPANPGDIHGVAPYTRIAFQHDLGGGTAELGAFALRAALWPGRDRSSGFTDLYSDLGLDASWIKTLGASDTVTINARYTHEKRSLMATCALGVADGSLGPVPLSDCSNGTLEELRADASYYWHNKIGATIGAFNLQGTGNAALYAGNRTMRPDSSGILLQLDGTPFGAGHSPFGPRFNMRLGVQYTKYLRFDGARRDFDGAGANASDNNTVRIFTWVAF